MIVDQCVICGVDVEGVKHSAKRKCYECHKKFARDYAHVKYLAAVENGTIYKYRKTASEYMRRKSEEDPIYRLLVRARSRAQKADLEFSIDPEDIELPEMCPVLQVPFEYRTYYTASLDRIDSSKGYVKGNIQVMSHKANAMKNSATPEELIKFAEWVLREYVDES